MSDDRTAEGLARAALQARESSSLLRRRRIIEPLDATHVRIDGQTLINFSSNDYLGLTHHPSVVDALRCATVAGAGAAALVAGHTPSHANAEEAIARWKGVDDAVLLPSGYQANAAAVGAMAAIAEAAGRTPRFLVDKLVHASLLDAIRATGSELRIYPHNGLAKLERLLSNREASHFDIVVTESIFSMDGDAADLRTIVDLRHFFDFAIVVDEAHASGLFGAGGAGLASELGVTAEIDLGIATFSKALGVVGGAVYGSRAMVEAVVNFGRAYVYTTSPPACVTDAISAAIEVCKAADDRRERLRANIARLRAGIARLGLTTVEGDSPIVPVMIGDEGATLRRSEALFEAGFLVVAVRPPTVPKGTSRLRLTVSSEHAPGDIDALLSALVA